MSGKAYSMREMKLLVDYLATNGLYGETRGRKMWMDFANTNLTVRTWQSLKETFLKRILPDISNPYYRLSPDQIMSFKRGVDLTQKDKKLAFVPVNESKKNDKSPIANGDNEQPCTSKSITEENAPGEDTQCSKIVHDRASTETLILDTCYETAEDIQKDLESTDEEQNQEKANDKVKPALKSVRDFIEYSEPLTPMLQEVLDDFATDEDCSDTEPPMQIDENYVAQDEPDAPVHASQSILAAKITEHGDDHATTGDKDNVDETGHKEQNVERKEESEKPTEGTAFSQLDDVMVLVDEALAKDLDKELNTQTEGSQNKANSHESSSALTDTLLPNNQEAIQSSRLDVNSPVLPTPPVSGRHGNKKTEAQVDPVIDMEQDMDAENPVEIGSNEEKTNNNDPPKQKPKQTTETTESSVSKSPCKPYLGDDKIHEIHSDSSTSNKETSQVDNPCLQSVSLYAEQMVASNYSDSDLNNKENSNRDQKSKQLNKGDTNRNEQQSSESNETKETDYKSDKELAVAKSRENVILLNSRTNSESVDSDKPLARKALKRQKDKKIASVFGFSNGGVAKSRRLAGRNRTTSHRSLRSRHSESESSGWTSTSDSEYVSPPHGRRNRYARKYLKPHSARVMSLDEEGGLFVMLGKRIYPLVKDGKAVKNYVTYLPESDPEEDESYWKSKYIDEKKRSAELKRKLGQSKSNGVLDKEEKESPVSMSSPVAKDRPKVPPNRQESIHGNEIIRRDSRLSETSSKQDNMLKIKYTKNDQEVQLEGHWQHINPVLAQVVSMFHMSSETNPTETVTCVELSSGNTTPIVTPPVTRNDTGVHHKINEMESEIFKEIEEKDSPDAEPVVEQQKVEEQEQKDKNDAPVENGVEQDAKEPQVTQRRKRGRPKKETSTVSVAQSVAKKPRQSTEGVKANNIEALKDQELQDSTPNVARLTRSPRKLLDGIIELKRTRKSTAMAQTEAPIEVGETPLTQEPDDGVRYKFPSPAPERRLSKSSHSNKISPKKLLPNIPSPESHSHHSVNSSHGYQDSDTSPFNIGVRRRRRLSASTLSIKGRKMRKNRSRSLPLLHNLGSESSNSFFNIKRGTEQSTINSEVYKSDSYQLLIPGTRTIMKALERIDETNAIDNDSLMDKIRDLRDEILKSTDNPTNKNDPTSSSNLSLPLSPELSIVENLTVSQREIEDVNHPIINEIHGVTTLNTCNNEYRLSQVDVSMPLMAQDCALQESYKKYLMSALSNLSDAPNSAGRNFSNASSMKISASESIVKSISDVNITSDSLDKRLEQLLLESAQKPPNPNTEEKMEVDTTVKKKGSTKRCSTPHKKKTVQNKRKSTEIPIIEEESIAHCSRSGRKSCPPTINIVYYENNAPDNLEINIQDEGINVSTITKGKRVKKDIIKVKIGRPKPKKKAKSKTPNVSRSSGITEGDNESGVFLQGLDDSSDLIHNHTETCLLIKDCMSDSVELIENATKSIISISSSSVSENKENLNGYSIESGKTSPELFCGNAQCATHFHDARPTDVKSVDSGNTVYFTPFMSSCNSVMTEDLSGAPVKSPVKKSSWHLFSEDETNTNYFDVLRSDTPSPGANLNQLFPITCAIPDLSTITEMSERNDSQKASLDADPSKTNS